MHRQNEQLTELRMRVKEWREYLREAREKCLDWIEKSRPYFGSQGGYSIGAILA